MVDQGDVLVLTDVEVLTTLEPDVQPSAPTGRVTDPEEVQAADLTGATVDGDGLVVFLGLSADDRLLATYVHDPGVDLPAGSQGEVEASSRATVSDTLDCLLERTGRPTRLEALLAAVAETQRHVGRGTNALHVCEG